MSIDDKVHEYHEQLILKVKNYNPGNINEINAEITNKTLDYWMQLKDEQQLPLFAGVKE